MAEEVVNFRIEYEVTGIDSSVRNTQRLLYAMNAVRLSIRDIQDVMAGPTLQNVMWTAIQLTRVWTSLWRLVKAVNKEQGIGMALGLGGGSKAVSRGLGGALGQTTLGFSEAGGLGAVAAKQGLMATLIGLAASNPVTTGIMVGALVLGGGILIQRQQQADWTQRQRDVAKTQGLEY